MQKETNFTAASNPTVLTHRVGRAYEAASALMEAIVADMSDRQQQQVGHLLKSGGRVGVELTTDGVGCCEAQLVGYTYEGARLTLARVATKPASPRH